MTDLKKFFLPIFIVCSFVTLVRAILILYKSDLFLTINVSLLYLTAMWWVASQLKKWSEQ